MNTLRKISAVLIIIGTLFALSSCSGAPDPEELISAELITSESNEQFEYKIYKNFAIVTQYIGQNAKIEIPEKLGGKTVRGIGSYAFYVNDTVESITIPGTVVSIGDSAFWGCTSIKIIEIPESVKVIEANAFRNCAGLQMVKMAPEGVTKIGNDCFEFCTALTSVDIPETVTQIGDNAFLGCIALKNITIPSGVAQIGNSAFANCPELVLKVVRNSYGNNYANENGLSFIAS
ncbi:MAG: leucine-rich repeat domain-containing protein [Clostridiales bacterium]|jgi:hypothetical protein|nr:leucine-rich repeat domain-containing protein [Clostridiales bacterium]